MAAIQWDKVGERLYETGVDRGVLYIPDDQGAYPLGVPWNGLTTVTESPSGAESNPQYADNIKYLNLKSAEEFGATIEAFTYPSEFAQFDGTARVNGVQIGQQVRRSFGFSWRSLVGNDLQGTDFGYKVHLVYGADAAPSERANATVNDSPEAASFSWEVTTTAISITGTNPITGKPFRPTAQLVIPSVDVTPASLAALEQILYGSEGVDPRLPLPNEVLALFAGTVTEVVPSAPTYDSGTHTITIPVVTGVTYKIDGKAVVGSVVITKNTVVTAVPNAGYKFPLVADDDWLFTF